MKSKLLIKIKLSLEYFLIYIIYKFTSILPINQVANLGGLLFKFIGPLTKTQKIVRKNYLQIFPNANEIKILKESKLSWLNIGKTFFELLILPRIIADNNKINVEGGNNIADIINNNEQVIFVGIHESNWEILLPTIDKLGIGVGGIYRHINNPHIDKLILNIRKKSILSNKSFYTPKGKQSAKDVISGIKKGLSLVLLVDQKDSAGELIPFFNKPSKTQIGFLKLAKKYNMKIIPVRNVRDKNNEFKVKFYPPLKNISKNFSDIETMKMIHSMIEEWIKDCPSSWFLQHNRFS
jgi:KDO2-lipid IV(A) lauroyltransferase